MTRSGSVLTEALFIFAIAGFADVVRRVAPAEATLGPLEVFALVVTLLAIGVVAAMVCSLRRR